jgi:hypothetical protein
MNTSSYSPVRRRFISVWFAAAAACLACHAVTAGDVFTLRPAASPFSFFRMTGNSSLPRFDDYRLTRNEPDALLSTKAQVHAAFPWAVNIPDFTFTLLFGGPKTTAARAIHAEKMKTRQVRRINDMIELTGATNPAQAKAWRTEMQRAMVAAR